MGGNTSRYQFLSRRPERDLGEMEEDEEGWPVQQDEDDTSGDDSYDSGNVRDMLRYLLRYRLNSG